jgi:hypothetical protein
MNRHARRQAKKLKTKTVQANILEIGEMVEMICGGVYNPDQHGFVAIMASDEGRRAVEAVFPSGRIAWRFYDDSPLTGWGEFSLDVVSLADEMPDHQLPLEITGGARLSDSHPDALALLLAWAVQMQGVNVATFDQNEEFNIYYHAMKVQ